MVFRWFTTAGNLGAKARLVLVLSEGVTVSGCPIPFQASIELMLHD